VVEYHNLKELHLLVVLVEQAKMVKQMALEVLGVLVLLVIVLME
jgi:hypothetical protein